MAVAAPCATTASSPAAPFTPSISTSRSSAPRAARSFQYSASRDARIAHPGVPLTPPLPQDERLPQLPPALVAANVGRLVVIQANLKPDGKLEAFHVLESPDQRLNDGIITSLTHWYFDPAAMGTDKIAVKVLFGIPIATAMADNGVSQQADQHMPADTAPRSPASIHRRSYTTVDRNRSSILTGSARTRTPVA